jgi:hypothetical protein
MICRLDFWFFASRQRTNKVMILNALLIYFSLDGKVKQNVSSRLCVESTLTTILLKIKTIESLPPACPVGKAIQASRK